MKKIGVLELCTGPATSPRQRVTNLLLKKQYISITPQAISVWCRQLGHQVYYDTYYGLGDPLKNVPSDLDIIFISVPTFLSALAYAIAKIYRMNGTRTVIGGPHAKAFSQDCARYFDLVVLDCDKSLIRDIIADQFAPGSTISSRKPYDEPPTIEARLPEIKKSAFIGGRQHWGSSIPMLASVGCPYSCDFCTDWNVPYRALSSDRLAADLRFSGEHLSRTLLYFHDPNFAVRFDETVGVFESTPPHLRNKYLVESSLKILTPERLGRLRDTNCLGMAPGVESWNGYANKAGTGKATGSEKVDQVVDQLRTLREFVPYLQANLILGLDTDQGEEPFELTKEFLQRTPFVWPQINIPMVFGGTPLFNTFQREGRILERVPFTFYHQPYLTVMLKHYDPVDYLQKMIEIHAYASSGQMLRRRWQASSQTVVAAGFTLRTLAMQSGTLEMKETVTRLQRDPHMRAFHAGETDTLPDFYATLYRRSLGRYAELMPVEESAPILSPEPVDTVFGAADTVW